jgi:hypothetical protein
MMGYEQDIEIDGLSLDKEWQFQSRLYMKYSRELADKRDLLARSEQKLDVVKAEADKRARQRHAADEKKPTEGVINSEVATDTLVEQQNNAVLDLRHEVDILVGVVRAFDHRKAALENLVTLHGQQYFSSPAVPHDIGREFVKKIETARRDEARDKVVSRGRRP